ncbi:MAG: MBOAT family protein [Clostridia bacterium]|nr:MBOAT family protein [Clostridia bacterium]
MVFSSLEFLFLYFPITILAYFLVPAKHLKWRNLVLLLVSLAFYGWGEPIYVFIMVFSIILDYTCGYFCGKYRESNPKKAKISLLVSVIVNLSILGFFKYTDFFITNINAIFGSEIPLLGLPLPIGISFYTFQTMSYTIDIYLGQARVQKNIASFGAYVTLFPQLIAGPIIRYQDIDDQLRQRDENVTMFASGVRTFMAGMGKKIFLANMAGAMWETFKAVPLDSRTVLGCWMGMIFYTFQIYFDFSAYSDMAIGLGKMLGFRFLENFNYPYIAKSITDFWRRWHMSLSTWFREYVYFPLGGSRCDAKRKTYRNIFVVWFLTGFWHGASWNYILWGLYYFALLVIEKTFLLKWLKKAPAFVSHIYTLFFVVLGWLLFVFEDMGAGSIYLGNMFGIGVTSFANAGDFYDIWRNILFIAILAIGATPYPRKMFYKLYDKHSWSRVAACAGGAVIMLFSVAYLVDSSFNPFLYFRF